jgi:hypothetical protein
MISKTKFYEQYSHQLVKVNNDDTESGEFMLFHPEERFIAADYIDAGYDIASVYETENGEDVLEIDNDISNHPYKIGYLVIKKQYKA